MSRLRGRPDNPITETGIKTEFTHHGFSSRFGAKRADRSHVWIDPILVGAPYIVAGAGVMAAARLMRRRARAFSLLRR